MRLYYIVKKLNRIYAGEKKNPGQYLLINKKGISFTTNLTFLCRWPFIWPRISKNTNILFIFLI